MRNYRAPGAAAKINLALAGLPAFRGLNGDDPKSKLRPHSHRSGNRLPRACFRRFEVRRVFDGTVSRHHDSVIGDPSLAPAGKHVMSIHVQFAPYKLKQGDWTTRRDEFANNVMRHLEGYAPGVARLDCCQPGNHTARSRTDLRSQWRTHPSRRTDIGSVFYFPSIDWLGAIPNSVKAAVSLRRRHASRRRTDGLARSERRPRDRARLQSG